MARVWSDLACIRCLASDFVTRIAAWQEPNPGLAESLRLFSGGIGSIVAPLAMGLLTASLILLGDAMEAVSGLGRDDLIAPVLLLLLGMVLGVGVLYLVLVRRLLRAHRARQGFDGFDDGTTSPAALRTRRPFDPRAAFELRAGFASPDKWLAIRHHDLGQIQASLGLRDTSPCSWEEGLNAAHTSRLFLSSPIRGWILVLGGRLPDPAEDVDQCFRLMQRLSRKLGQVQFYQVNRALNHHAWVVANRGVILRAYAWAGQTLWNQGPLTRDEIELGIVCRDYVETGSDFEFGHSSAAVLNTDKVSLLAARWSVDPNAIDVRSLAANRGLAGDASMSL